MNISSLNLRK